MNVHIEWAEISLYLSMKFTSGGSGSSVSQVVKPRLKLIVSGLHTGDSQPIEPPLRSGGYQVGDRRAGWIRRAGRVVDSPIYTIIFEPLVYFFSKYNPSQIKFNLRLNLRVGITQGGSKSLAFPN